MVTKCPECKSENIEMTEDDYDGDEGTQDVRCNDCGHEWRELWRFVKILKDE